MPRSAAPGDLAGKKSRRDRFSAVRPRGVSSGLQTVINYALQQSLIPRKIDVEELFDATTRALPS
jgi:hypothetical protein